MLQEKPKISMYLLHVGLVLVLTSAWAKKLGLVSLGKDFFFFSNSKHLRNAVVKQAGSFIRIKPQGNDLVQGLGMASAGNGLARVD